MTITSAAGCKAVDTQLVRVFKEKNIYVPGGFSPDGDGQNDRLYPITVGIRELRYFKVFNRWGQLIFETRITSPTAGWDGSWKGKPMPLDTYTWIAEGIDVDGLLLQRSGNTILIR